MISAPIGKNKCIVKSKPVRDRHILLAGASHCWQAGSQSWQPAMRLTLTP